MPTVVAASVSMRALHDCITVSRQGAKKRPAKAQRSPTARWLPTARTVKHRGAVRKLWRSAADASVLAVKRIVRAADGSRKARFERVPEGAPSL